MAFSKKLVKNTKLPAQRWTGRNGKSGWISCEQFKSILFSGLLLLCSFPTIIKGNPSTERQQHQHHNTNLPMYQSSNFSSYSPTSSPDDSSPESGQQTGQNFRASPSIENPVFASRSHAHIHEEYPPSLSAPSPNSVVDKGAKGRLDSKALAIDKSPPELQFGLSFTVPFISVSTERLLSTLSGKSFGDDPYSDVASLLKLNVGGLVVAAIVGVAALIFIPTLLPGKLPGLFSGGFPHGLMPSFLDQFMPGLGLNKPFGYGQYDHAYDPYTGDYSGSSGSYNLHRQEDGRGRALKSGNSNGTVYNQIFSTVQKAVHQYWGEVETCAAHAMCLRGKLATEERQKRSHEGGTGGKHSGRNSRRLEDDLNEGTALTSFEHILEAIQGMKGITKNMPLFHQLHKAFKAGQHGSDCSEEYKQCPVTPDHINKAIQNMGNYIFN